ncbi:uncharacterized protein [Lepeophtheirus salmonis]|uniref:uncharacterized protein isoform X1 n=2 Tax=Lepeophtheirus salmonis TaxID=72036 RepID=UPI001AE645AA|nr:uncharacterized protein LOC121123142 isoform X1 [Lepeophtheirus salmonis]
MMDNSDIKIDEKEKNGATELSTNEINAQIRRRKKETPEPLSDEIKERLLDMKILRFSSASKRGSSSSSSSSSSDSESDTDDEVKFITFDDGEDGKLPTSPTEFKPNPKMNTFVGFLRLANYVGAVCAVFGIVLSVFWHDELNYKENVPIAGVLLAASCVQILYLVIVAILVMIDSIATVTFRWKEYGELCQSQTDATSIVFLFCESRWAWRLITGFIISSAISLKVSKLVVPPYDVRWYVGLIFCNVISSILGYIISKFPWHGVAWLYDRFKDDNVEDKGDKWIKPVKVKDETTKKRAIILDAVFNWIDRIFIVALNIIALTLFLYTIVYRSTNTADPEFWFVIGGTISLSFLTLFSLSYNVILCILTNFDSKKKVPSVWKFVAPYVLTCSAKFLMDTNLERELGYTEGEFILIQRSFEDARETTALLWPILMVLALLLFSIEMTRKYCHKDRAVGCWNFLLLNMKEEGINKKIIRFFDTAGSLFALSGLIFGITSLFVDQYDLVFDPEGIVKDIVNGCKMFQVSFRPVKNILQEIIKVLDKKFTCSDVYKTLGAGSAAALFASFFPGASSVVTMGSRSAYYGVRAANALTNLSKKLKKSLNMMWQTMSIVRKLSVFTGKSLKKFVLANNSVTLTKLLPFLPPVILGIYVLFACFWPQRILFFTRSQRIRTIKGLVHTWFLSLGALIFSVLINTAIVDELTSLLNNNIPLATVTLERKLGWTLSMVASGLAMGSVVSYFISTIILYYQTKKDHANITNEELDWKREVERRELVVVRTPLGAKYEKRTQLKYKKDRISGWNWILPILLCGIACGFGYLANIHPKLEMHREPKGVFGRILESVLTNFNDYEQNLKRVKGDAYDECLPYATFDEVLAESNILVNPVNKFFNETEKVLKPLRDIIRDAKKQIVTDIEDELLGGKIHDIWQTNDLKYVGFLLMAPRLVGLLILIFGGITSCIWLCQMKVYEPLEPIRIIRAYGKVAKFSILYVIGGQLALFNVISSFGVPFYHLNIRFGPGFVYDVVADCIMISVYIGMQNEFFFSIPRKKTTVTYTVSGISQTCGVERNTIL